MLRQFTIGLPEIHRQFHIGLPKIYRRFCNSPPKMQRRFRICPPHVSHVLLAPEFNRRELPWSLLFWRRKKTHLLKHVYLKDMACYAGLLLAPAEGKNISYSGVSAHFRTFRCQVNFPGLNTAFLNREYFFTIDLLYFSVLVWTWKRRSW